MDKKFERYCPKCGKLLLYLTEKTRDRKEKIGQVCLSCSVKGISKPLYRRYKNKQFDRRCSRCDSAISYTTIRKRDHAERKLKLCNKCAGKGKHNNSGKNNPFYGKTHSKETKERLAAVDKSYTQTDDFKRKCIKAGESNGMHSKSLYDVWLTKYGKEEADKRQANLNIKRSENALGVKNGMYGKPSPMYSGKGWSGWYKGWYFRSLRELSYVINVLEVKKLIWKSAECFRIPYIDSEGHNRTYSPDFLVNNSILVEIKPKRLKTLGDNKFKKIAATKYCKEHNLIFKIFDVRRNRLTIKEFVDLYQNRKIELIERCEKAINKRIESEDY
jgi:ribosomal protein S21